MRQQANSHMFIAGNNP